jgi:hypothetical protein
MPVRDVEKLNRPILLGLDCQIQAMRRRIWLSGGSDETDLSEYELWNNGIEVGAVGELAANKSIPQPR